MPQDRLELAKKQLAKVQTAWFEPTDWSDLTLYGLYAIENAIMAAAESLGLDIEGDRTEKITMARRLQQERHLPEVDQLLQELNEMRKHFSYGEAEPETELDPETIASDIESYIDAVENLVLANDPQVSESE